MRWISFHPQKTKILAKKITADLKAFRLVQDLQAHHGLKMSNNSPKVRRKPRRTCTGSALFDLIKQVDQKDRRQ